MAARTCAPRRGLGAGRARARLQAQRTGGARRGDLQAAGRGDARHDLAHVRGEHGLGGLAVLPRVARLRELRRGRDAPPQGPSAVVLLYPI